MNFLVHGAIIYIIFIYTLKILDYFQEICYEYIIQMSLDSLMCNEFINYYGNFILIFLDNNEKIKMILSGYLSIMIFLSLVRIAFISVLSLFKSISKNIKDVRKELRKI